MQAVSVESLSPTIGMKEATPSTTSAEVPTRQENARTDDSTNPTRGISVSLRANIHFATLCWAAVLNGWSDSSTGPLLPRIEQVYHVRPWAPWVSDVALIWETDWVCGGLVDICIYNLGK